jgi:hypothetical protein
MAGSMSASSRTRRVDARLHGARELLEHQVLVLHLGGEAAGLEQALAIPLQASISAGSVCGWRSDRRPPAIR